MSLHVYTELTGKPTDIQFIDYNDIFFNSVALKDDAITRTILEVIDKAKYNSANTIIGRDPTLGALNKNCLSTGCKTLLNILYNPDKCFDLIECGTNVLELLPIIKNGNVYWRYPIVYFCNYDDVECDIETDNKHFDSFRDFLGYVREQYEYY